MPGKDLVQQKTGISRRNVLRLLGGGTIAALLPGHIETDMMRFDAAGGKKLIFVVGDGMPLGVIRAMHEVRTRFFGDRTTNIYARMADTSTVLAFMGTGSLSSIVSDSAPASAAWSTGSKTMNGMLAVLPDGRPLTTIMELLKRDGYGTGLVTTTRVTHATPAAWVSHQMHRDSEEAVALDYLAFRPDVLLGGGSKFFNSAHRSDRRDLFAEFEQAGYHVVKNRAALMESNGRLGTQSLLGIFSKSHMSYAIDRINDKSLGAAQPSLPEMTAAALRVLSRNPKGFILQVEAGRIDHASHSNDAWAAINDMYELDLTLGVIDEYLAGNPDTLVIVASDHGNSGWGVNGTGPNYNDSTLALKQYLGIRSSFEVMGKYMKGKGADEIRMLFERATGVTITAGEAESIHASMQSGYVAYPGDFLYYPDAMFGRILAHSEYPKNAEGESLGPARLRRGNVGFTSTNHTAEDQIVLAYGNRTSDIGIGRYIDNTALFQVMCRYFGITHRNPAMTEEQAKPFLKIVSAHEWQRHLRLHIA